MEFITIQGQPFEVAFDIDRDDAMVVETKAVCPDCHGTDWRYDQLCQAGYPGVLECRDCELRFLVESK